MQGVLATILVLVVALLFISLFTWPTFSGWVSYSLMCAIPASIVIGAVWKAQVPRGIARQVQPVQGLLYLGLTAAVAAVVAFAHWYTRGGAISPPVPMAIQTIIVSVVVAFWLAIMFGGWPFVLIANRLVAGLVLLVGIYVVNAVLFQVFFDYGFLKGAPFYRPDLDPHGLFTAWDATVFPVTCLAVMFLMLHFDLWPLSRVPALMNQPALGLVWTLVVVVIGGGVFLLGTRGIGLDAPVFMVRVPIPFIFGSVVLLNMLQGSLFPRLAQPLKGLFAAVTALVVGIVLALGYALLMPVVTGSLAAGAPTYDAELWLANALLAVTFPFLAFHADFFRFWPLGPGNARGPAEPAMPVKPVKPT